MKATHFDPLEYYYNKTGYNPDDINRLITGEKFTAVLLANGNIGVCSNLNHKYSPNCNIPEKIDLTSTPHRIIYNAYLNAVFNYENHYDEKLDIFNAVDFSGYRQITMIGYFIPLVKKFDDINIPVNVFDRAMQDERLLPEDKKDEYVESCDCLIISGTTLQNNTFARLHSITPPPAIFIYLVLLL